MSSSRRRRKKWNALARLSPHSSCRRMPRAAPSRSKARWWSGCMPIWHAARLLSRIQSRRWRIKRPHGEEALRRQVYAACVDLAAPPSRTMTQRGFILRDAALRLLRMRSTKFFRRPGMQAARHRLLVAAALWRDVKSNDAGIADQRRKIPWIEEQFGFGVHGIERLLWQRIAQFAEAVGERGKRRRAENRQPDIGDVLGPA